MNETQANKIPPIVEQYIAKLTDRQLTDFQRDIAATNLENIRSAINIALDQYNNKRMKVARK